MQENRRTKAVAELRRFACQQEATTAAEYAFMLALIILGLIGAISTVASKVDNLFAAVVEADW